MERFQIGPHTTIPQGVGWTVAGVVALSFAGWRLTADIPELVLVTIGVFLLGFGIHSLCWPITSVVALEDDCLRVIGYEQDRCIAYADILSARHRIDQLVLQLKGEASAYEIPDCFFRRNEKRLLLTELHKRIATARQFP
jgi:hypothetical protein